MEVLQIIEKNINQRYIDQVVETLKDGGLIIYPTDTVYALGCDALNNQAIERICSMKEMKSAKTTSHRAHLLHEGDEIGQDQPVHHL